MKSWDIWMARKGFMENPAACRSYHRMRAKLTVMIVLSILFSGCERASQGSSDARDGESQASGSAAKPKARPGFPSAVTTAKPVPLDVLDTARRHPGKLVKELLEIGHRSRDGLDKEALRIAYEAGSIEIVFDSLNDVMPPYCDRYGVVLRELGELLGESGDASQAVLSRLSEVGKHGAEGMNCLFSYVRSLEGGSEGKADGAIHQMKLPKRGQDLLKDCLAREIAKSNPEKGLEYLQGLPSDLANGTGSFIMSEWLGGDSATALEALQRTSREQLFLWLKNDLFVDRLSKVDPSLLVEEYKQMPLTEESLGVIQRGVKILAAENGPLAFGLVSSLPPGGKRDRLMMDLFSDMVVNVDPTTIEKIQQLGGDDVLVERGLIRGIAQHDVQKAVGFVSGLPNGGSGDASRELGRIVALSSPETAVSLIADEEFSQKVGVPYRSEMIDFTVRTWAGQNLGAARAWVANLPSRDQPNGVRGLMNTWMKSDPVAASAWLASMPAGPARDAGAIQIIAQVRNTDPEMAQQWRKSLTTPATGTD